MTEKDLVNHPDHYNYGEIEVIDIIEQIVVAYDSKTSYSVGNVIKYLARAPFKGTLLRDLKKAEWYLKRAIDNLEKE